MFDSTGTVFIFREVEITTLLDDQGRACRFFVDSVVVGESNACGERFVRVMREDG